VRKEFGLKLKAGDFFKAILSSVNGKGGGSPNFAQGGSQNINDASKIMEAFENGSLIEKISMKL
jgi:alanyl-tRNA synthetase